MDATREQIARLLKRGLNHYGLGDLDAAIACWEQARDLDPENRAAHDYLETAYEESGRAEAAGPGKQGSSSALGSAVVEAPEVLANPSGAGEIQVENAFDEDATPRTFDGPPTPPPAGRLPALPVSETEEIDTVVGEALHAYKQGKLGEAWRVLKDVADTQPDRLDVQGYLIMVRSERARQWARDIGDQGRSLRLKRTMQELMSMNLQPDEGFLLSQIDGNLSIEQLLNLSGDRVRSLEVLSRFIKEGLVE